MAIVDFWLTIAIIYVNLITAADMKRYIFTFAKYAKIAADIAISGKTVTLSVK